MKYKYKLTDESTVHNGKVLYRIECVTAFADVKAGDKGGWVEACYNLSQRGNSWVYGNAKVYDKAWVYDNAKVYDNAWIYGSASVYDNAEVYGVARVYDKAQVFGEAQVYGGARVYNNAKVCRSANVRDWARIGDNALIFGNALICGDASIGDKAEIYGNAVVFDCVCGEAHICGDSIVATSEDYIVFKNNFSSLRSFTWTKSNDKWSVGCFYGTGEELIKKAYADSQKKGECYKAYVELVEKLKLINTDS